MNFNVFVLFVTAKVSWADAVEDPDYPMPPLVFKDQKLDNKYMFSKTVRRGICHSPLGINRSKWNHIFDLNPSGFTRVSVLIQLWVSFFRQTSFPFAKSRFVLGAGPGKGILTLGAIMLTHTHGAHILIRQKLTLHPHILFFGIFRKLF